MTDSDSRQRLVAILAADAVGYSRLMAGDECATVAALDSARQVFRIQIENYQGRVVDMAGDSVLAVFETAAGAVAAAIAVQHGLDASRASVPEDRQMRFRIGVHLGDILEKGDGSVYGDGVNIAARLQALAEIGGITVSDAVHGAVRGKVAATFVDGGEQAVKNIPHPVRAFAWTAHNNATSPARAAADTGASPPGNLSIAVLPFTNMSGDPEQDYFADGMAEDVITELARMRVFFVIARNSSFSYKGKAVDIKQVGRELGVRYVLEGSVRKSGGRVRITGQLIEAQSGGHVWADRFEGSLDDVFELQDRVTNSIVCAMEPNMRRADIERARAKPTANLQAYDLLLRAYPGLLPNSTPDKRDDALSFIRQALQMDPHYALAKALAAYVCCLRLFEGYGDAQDVKTGLRFAQEALSHNSDDPVVLSLAGMAVGSLGFRALGLRVLGFRYDEAQGAIERALSLAPGLLHVQYCAGTVRALLGEGEAALGHFERAMRISPLDPAAGGFMYGIAGAHLICGRYAEALATAQRANRESPNFVGALRLMVLAFGFLGRIDDAKPLVQRVLALTPAFTVSQYLSVSPHKDPDFRKRVARIYRAAGVPK